MNPTLEACLQSWSFAPGAMAGLLITAALYLRGGWILRRRGATRPTGAQAAAFLAGLGVVLLALVSPLDTLGGWLLSVHMLQHLLLMILGPILLWAGEPLRVLERGLPRPIIEVWLVPLRRTPWIRHTAESIQRPVVAALIFIGTMWAWHLPGAYEVALNSPAWHHFEHATFVLAGLVFWRPVIEFLQGGRVSRSRRGGRRPARPYWLLPYLFVTDVAGTLLGAILAFSGHVLYPHYSKIPTLTGMSALDDQALAGGLMWVLGSIALLAPLAWIGFRLLAEEGASDGHLRPLQAPRHRVGRESRIAATAKRIGAAVSPLNGLFRGATLHRRTGWRIARATLLLLAAAIVVDGLSGPQVAAMNLAGVLPWVHWRGMAVLGVLLAGNVVCASCPFPLARSTVRRLVRPRWDWPAILQGKWLSAGLLLAFFLAYEVFDLWASPWWTAWLVLGYFAAVAVVDGLFRGGAFCRHACPIGQFHVVESLVRPTTNTVRHGGACGGCHALERRTHQLAAALPIVVRSNPPAAPVLPRERFDLSCLILLFVFAAFANALGMVAPIVQEIDRIAEFIAWPRQVVEAVLFLVAVLIAPAFAIGCAATIERLATGRSFNRADVLGRAAAALLPLGVSMWVAHYSFHLLSGPWSFVPVGERFLADWGVSGGAEPHWRFNCCAPVADWLLKFEILALDFGWLAALYAAYRTAVARGERAGHLVGAWLPWAGLATLLFALGVWIVFQPMEMRGMLSPGSAG